LNWNSYISPKAEAMTISKDPNGAVNCHY
jgi:hypothetical protein